MALIDIASSKSVWRGIEYYNQGKVISWSQNEDGTYDAKVAGSGDGDYTVHVDLEHPRKSACNCPLANGKRIICKHIVAVSFCVDESEAERFKKDLTPYHSLEEEVDSKRYDKYLSFAKTMSKKELNEAYAEAMVELEKYQKKEKYGK